MMVCTVPTPSRPLNTPFIGTATAQLGAGVLDALAGDGDDDAVKPDEGELLADDVVDGWLEGDAPLDSVAVELGVIDDVGVLDGVGLLEGVPEGVADGSWYVYVRAVWPVWPLGCATITYTMGVVTSGITRYDW